VRTYSLLLLLLLPCLAACGPSGQKEQDPGSDRKEYALPVRVTAPSRGTVVDYVETQATLETDEHVDVYAEVDGRIVARHRDVGDQVGIEGDGSDPLLLAEIDDRDLRLALKEAEIQLEEQKGRIRELALEKERAQRELGQAQVTVTEAESTLARTTEGIKDGTISMEEHEKASFAFKLASKKVETAETALAKAEVALGLGDVAVEQAGVVRDRAAVALERATIRAPLPGVVTLCNVREGERVRTGDLLYRVENPATLVVYGDLPVRQALRVNVGDEVRLSSSALPATTEGRVLLVAPTVNRESGTVRVKVAVEPAEGYLPGLFVTLRIVTETRTDALVVPQRAVLHDDEEGAYLFTVRDGAAARLPVTTGFDGDGVVEIREGLAEDASVVVEGQDTLADGAKVEVQAGE